MKRIKRVSLEKLERAIKSLLDILVKGQTATA